MHVFIFQKEISICKTYFDTSANEGVSIDKEFFSKPRYFPVVINKLPLIGKISKCLFLEK